MNKPFNIIRLYRNLDNWKNLHRKQLLQKHKLKYKYHNLMDEYKKVIVENANLRAEVKNTQHTE